MVFTPNILMVFATQSQLDAFIAQVDEKKVRRDDKTYRNTPCVSGSLGQTFFALVETDPFEVAVEIGAAQALGYVHTLLVHKDLAVSLSSLSKFVKNFGVRESFVADLTAPDAAPPAVAPAVSVAAPVEEAAPAKSRARKAPVKKTVA